MKENTKKLLEITSRADHNGVVHASAESTTGAPQDVKRLASTVTKVAGSLGVQVSDLFDSNAFIDQITTLLPEDTKGITAAVKSAIDANPQLVKTLQGPGVRAPLNTFERIKSMLNQGGPII